MDAASIGSVQALCILRTSTLALGDLKCLRIAEAWNRCPRAGRAMLARNADIGVYTILDQHLATVAIIQGDAE
jgi:hypothetical protein